LTVSSRDRPDKEENPRRLGLRVRKACEILLESFPDPPETCLRDNGESNPVEY